MPNPFDRALAPAFIAQLRSEAGKGGWWADVLADPSLVIGLRGNYLNVYWKGLSLFRAAPAAKGVRVTTHPKYLLDPKLREPVSLLGGRFDVGGLGARGFVKHYEGPATLAKLKQAAGLFSVAEKRGCHEIAVGNASVIDVEIAFPGSVSLGKGENSEAPRVDLASVEPDGDGARLVFWEAKTCANNDLQSARGQPASVCRQIEFYRSYLRDNRDALASSYTRLAANLLAIRDMGWARPLAPVIAEVGDGRRQLRLGEPPGVGLVVFGFDVAARDEAGWRQHLERLPDDAPVRVAGDAKRIRLSSGAGARAGVGWR